MSELRISKSVVPTNRPSFSEWIKEMRISHAAWYYGEGRERAERINAQLGVPDAPSIIENVLGRESEEYQRWRRLKELNLK